MAWKTICHSVTGTTHIQNGVPCQDYGASRVLPNGILIAAVADGAGCAPHAQEGARLAVEASLEFCAAECEHGDLKTIFGRLLKHLNATLQAEAQKQNWAVDDLASTLLLCIAKPVGFVAMQIGDGFIVLRGPDEECRLLFSPDHGQYVNETTFVTSENAREKMQVRAEPTALHFLCMGTDGMEKVALSLETQAPHRPFFHPLEDFMRNASAETISRELERQLNSKALNARTDDDKTLLVSVRT